jgi:hypothetical protein
MRMAWRRAPRASSIPTSSGMVPSRSAARRGPPAHSPRPATVATIPRPGNAAKLLGLTHHQASVSRGADERIRERVLGVALDSGHQRQQVVLGRPVEADDVCELRQSLGERAGLVDGHRLHAREILECLGALDEHALARD